MNTVSSRASIPNPTPLLFLFAGTIAWCLVWIEEPNSPWLWLVLALAACILVPASVSVLAARPSFAVVVLLVAVVMPRFFVSIGALKARPEHIACGLLLLALPFWLRERREPMKWFAPDYLIAGYLGMHIFSSLVMSVSPLQTIKWASQQVLVITAYFLVRVLVVDRAAFRRMFNTLLLVGALEAAYSIICFYSNFVFGTEFGMEIGQYGDIPGTYGTHMEANLLGSTSGACCAMMLGMYLREKKGRFLLGFAVTFAAMAISLSRGALLGTMIGLALVVFRNRKYFDRQKVNRLGLAMLGVALTVAPAVLGLWTERISTVDVSDIETDDTTRDRVVVLGLASEGILEHPLLGNGTASFQLQFSSSDLGYGDSGDYGTWIGNTVVRILYDTGLVGFGLFLALIIFLGVRVKKLLKKTPNAALDALTLAFVIYLVAFQFTEGTLLAFPWVHLGLIASGIAVFEAADGSGPNLLSGEASPQLNHG